jgi:hypothetical protein
MNPYNLNTNLNDNFELNMLQNSIANLNNYIRSVNSSIEYLNNASANIRYMHEHINYYYHANNFQVLVNNTGVIARQNNNNNNTNNNNNNEFTYEYFQELSLHNLKNIIVNNITECSFCTLCNPLNDTCTITHEEFTQQHSVTKINSCGHIFNSKAISDWLITHQTCPNCRYNILSNSNIISYNDQDNNNKLFFNIDELLKYFLFIHQ